MVPPPASPRRDWNRKEVERLFGLPFDDLILQAQLNHRSHHNSRETEISTMLQFMEHRFRFANPLRSSVMQIAARNLIELGSSRDARIAALYDVAQAVHPRQLLLTGWPTTGAVRTLETRIGHVAGKQDLELVRTIAVTRILMPASRIQVAAPHGMIGELVQTLCFMAGANSIFFNDAQLSPSRMKGCVARILTRMGMKI